MISVSFPARRLLPLAPQKPQVGHTRRIDVEAAAIGRTVQQAFGFELTDAISCCASADVLTIARFVDRGRETGLATAGP